MVDNPDKLREICLRKFVSLLKYDEFIWKKQIEGCINQIYEKEKSQSSLNGQRKRKYNTTDDDDDNSTLVQKVDYSIYETQLKCNNRPSFLEQFLRGICPLNAILSERLVDYLVRQNQLNDFTLTLFSSNVTSLKRIVLNVKYLSQLQCHILQQHSNLSEIKIIFKDLNNNRSTHEVNKLLYQHICPSLYSKFDDIYTVYGPLVLHHLRGQSPENLNRISLFNRYLFQRSPALLEGFSHQRIFNTVLNSLHPLTFQRLKILNIAHYKFFAAYHSTSTWKHARVDMSPLNKCSTHSTTTIYSSVNIIPTNLRLILKFINLTSLNINNTDIKNHCLDLIIDSLEKLHKLDISSCSSLTSFNCLSKLATKLKSLNLYNCSFQMQQNPTIYEILHQLKHLEYLDISTDNENSITNTKYNINGFLSEPNCLSNLKELDLSGQKNISSKSLYKFLLSHKNLEFLGLFLTDEKCTNCLFDRNDLCYSKLRLYTYDLNDITIENDAHLYEPYLIESLKRYYDRVNFVQKILYYIFFLTRSYQSKYQNLLIDLILHTMSIHRNSQSIQLASTACIYNLTRSPIIEQIHLKSLTKIVESIMTVMEYFPNQQQLQKNCLLALCSDRILHEPNFNFFLLASLVMNNLQNHTDSAIIQPGVAILALLTSRLTVEECTKLGSVINIHCLLQLIEHQVNRLQAMQNIQNHASEQPLNHNLLLNNDLQLTGDDTLRFCLSLLWNLTDENPIVCERFVHSNGLQLFQRLIHLFSTDTIILTKILGVLSNISEVSHLIMCLYSIDIIPLIQKFLTDAIIDIAFSAAGILAHLLFQQINRELNLELCQYMKNAILKWQNPDRNIITYRSFKPFLPLLHCTQIPVIQLWAVWAIHHVCSTDRARYIRIMREEKLYDLIQKLYFDQISSDHCDKSTIQLLNSILHLLEPYYSNNHKNSSAVAS
ncbi:unnamed protein product [Rotaria socialis]|uniref:Protein zer-1 homolog-like C-terminal domain-containing protein n=2 Tax=Rotaria socialis TaxID=392032 RepID=A0A818Q1T5_9BILA|nr:unnamed protein product [Rotaria socialis]CAF4265573.1 unnamed protein product [Rotaria socialis]